MKMKLNSQEGIAGETPEFFPLSVLFIVGVLFLAFYQLSGGPTNIIQQPSSRRVNPLSFISLAKGIGILFKSIQLANYTAASSITAKLIAGFYAISYVGFSWAPRNMGLSEISPSQMGMKISDLMPTTMSSFPSIGYITRFLLHLFYVCPLTKASTSAIFYWILYIPLCFYLIFTLLDGAFIGGRVSTSTSATNLLSQLFRNIVMVIIGQFVCMTTALHSNRVSTIFQLPHAGIFYGPEPLLFSLFIVLFYRNPIVYPAAFNDPSLQFPYVVETRWIISVLLLFLTCVTPWKYVPTILLSGGLGGLILISREWIHEQQQRGREHQVVPSYRKFQFLGLIAELSVYYVSFFISPVSSTDTPSLTASTSIFSNPSNLFSSKLPSLWVTLCYGDAVARCLAKILTVYLPLIPFIPPSAFSSSCRTIAMLFCFQLFYAMNSATWAFPHIGFILHAIGAYRLFAVIPSYGN